MFGHLTLDSKYKDETGKARYRSYYCGLCRELNASYGRSGRNTLSYDAVFLAMLHSSLYEMPEQIKNTRCLHRAFSLCACALNEA
ncbi:MAG: DUF5685 family protein, partial [Defluviitaleaceae bacterium]|nr:DUF5685 family protein [Defluviitaleaceae bacterium]